ncbi:hypothetical protein [Varibaculum cambriense]|uniref:hypothetical protein n=1 Tax=Varibaculum cambriense TaxID=184870 RepID=UPI0029018581|nr:hypothetical protein [Varibaculum cambriense]MDU1225114.1 hypothetical protein [Varibaculum cambriense]
MTDPDPRMATPQNRIWRALMYAAGSIRTAQGQLNVASECVLKAMETCTPYAGEYDTYESIFTDTADMENALAWINDQTAQAQVELATIPKSVLDIRHELTQLEKEDSEDVEE